jgi:hypothetical protein
LGNGNIGKERKKLGFEGVADNSHLFLEIRPDEYVFYGYYYFSTDIVWSKYIKPAKQK